MKTATKSKRNRTMPKVRKQNRLRQRRHRAKQRAGEAFAQIGREITGYF